MICPGCFQPKSFLYPTRLGDRCASCKDEIPNESLPAEAPPRGEPRAGRVKVISVVEEQLWGDIRKIMKTDPKLRDPFKKGQVLAYQKAISYLAKHKRVSFKNNGTEKVTVAPR